MTSQRTPIRHFVLILSGLFLLVTIPEWAAGQAPVPANVAYDRYVLAAEGRLARQHEAADGFLAPADDARLRAGEAVVEQITPAGGARVDGGLIHHWRGTAFAPGATVAAVKERLQEVKDYPRLYAPQVMDARVLLRQSGGRTQVAMRVRQKHVLTVVMDTVYDVRFGSLDARHGFSSSVSTRIAEIGGAGTAAERVLDAREEHGFLWRQNTYWSFEERDGGVVLQLESISLSRGVPRGLGWAVGPFVESVPRESVEFTLRATRAGLGKEGRR